MILHVYICRIKSTSYEHFKNSKHEKTSHGLAKHINTYKHSLHLPPFLFSQLSNK